MLRSLILVSLALSLAPAPEIAWLPSFEKTLERAKAERKVVFLAVNMDGEKANERLVDKVYTDKAIVELSQNTLCLVASAAEHAAADKTCPRFHGLYCLDHRRTDTAARNGILKSDEDGLVVAPQHVFLDPDGKVLVSVPYEITQSELEWCFVTALQKGDPNFKGAMPAGARMPRRIVVGGVYDPKSAAGGSVKPLTHKELLELVKELKKGTLRGDERFVGIRRILSCDDKEALDFIEDELKSGGLGGGGGAGGGGGGGGGGRFGGGGRDGGADKHKRILHAIGVISPPGYAPLVAEFLDDSDPVLRGEAAVALEQLGTPESVRPLLAALQKEEDVAIGKDLLRALGACGAGDAKVRTLLVKRAKSEKSEVLRLNAIVALGSLDPEPEVKDALRTILEKGHEHERTAAACAAAWTRDPAWIEIVTAAGKDTKDEALAKAVAAALDVLKGADVKKIQDSLSRIAQDKIHRERFFGKTDA